MKSAEEKNHDCLDISRRSFLKSMAAVGSVAAMSGFAGCAPAANKSDTLSVTAEASNQSDAASVRTSFSRLNPQNYDYCSNTTKLETLFSEVTIGNLTIPNRMVKSAAGSDTAGRGSDSTGEPQPLQNPEELLSYYRNFAKGGIGLIWMEDLAQADMFEHFPRKGYQIVENIPFEEIVSQVHAEGSYIGYQISCMGAVFSGTNLSSAFGASSVAGDLSPQELKDLIADYISAAKRLQGFGFDAVEINAAGNNIGQSFLSRMRNKREDEYGPQSIENRARFLTDIISGIKRECGKDLAVQVLLNGIEENDEHIGNNFLMTTIEENVEIAKLLEKAGADSLHVRIGPMTMHPAQFLGDLYFIGRGIDGTTGYGNQFDFTRHFEGKLAAENSGCGLMLDVAAEFKKAVSIPVGSVTYMDPAHAPDLFENALADDKLDFLLMNRPFTVDPEYVNKLKEGRIDEIAPCTRCIHCYHDKTDDGKKYEHCRVNACTQRAFRADMPEGCDLLPANGSKNVMVIGGGPAGMEAARIAAKRGYSVTLYEKKSSLGGLLEFASVVKGPHENLDALRAYLERQLEVNGVSVVTGQEVDAEFVKSDSPDVVILATGGMRDTLNLAATANTSVLAISDYASEGIGENVTIAGGNAQAVDIALYLQEQGKYVTMVFPEELGRFERGHSDWVKTFIQPMMYARGLRVLPESSIESIGDGTITVKTSKGVDMTIECDTVIEAMDMLPNKDLLDSISGIEAYAVGDCDSPFNIAEAIFAGNKVARNI